MTTKEAVSDYKELMFKIAKAVDQLGYVRERMHYINEQMGWDGMFELNFDTALRELAIVEAAAITYSFEDEYRSKEIANYESQLNALKDCEK